MLHNKFLKAAKSCSNGMFTFLVFAAPLQIQAASATTPVPAHTLFQATKLVQMQYPGASNISARPYQSISISGTVGKVLNSSTEVEFMVEEQARKVVMLPDGQHLLVGEIIKPSTSNHSQGNIGSKAIQRNLKPGATSSVLSHRPVYTPAPAVIATPQNPMDKYRLTSEGIDKLPGQANLTPDALMSQIEEHEALVTGNGPNHLYVFTDPNCPNCRNEYISSKQHLDDFTFHWIPIYGVTVKPQPQQIAITQDSEEANLSNLEKIMTNPQAINLIKLDITDSVAIRLRDHQQLFYNIKDKRTPVSLYRNAEGVPTIVNGYSNRLYSFIQDDMTLK